MLLTRELGLVRARAEGLRKPGAKLSHALQTLSYADVTLLKGKDGWRLAGAVLLRPWFRELTVSERLRAGKRASLILRLVQGETGDTALFDLFVDFLTNLPQQSESEQRAQELRTTLLILSALGHDEGGVPALEELLGMEKRDELALIARAERGINASGL
jgi:recombinational DNA repair protein (RecF pathway)